MYLPFEVKKKDNYADIFHEFINNYEKGRITVKEYKMNVSLAFDNNYIQYAYITLMSLFINNSDAEISVFILQYDLSSESRRILTKLAEGYGSRVIFLDIYPEKLKSLPVNKWPVQVYFRLLLTEICPDELDRILYLDSDIIVNASLKELYLTQFEDNDLCACYDLNLLATTEEIFLYHRHPALAPLLKNKCYINSGMLLFNLEKMRKKYSLNSYMEACVKLEGKIYAPDQDLINYVHAGRIKPLDPCKYNYPAYIAFIDGKRSNNASEIPIMHFVCEKPWQGGNHAHFETEMIWWKYALKSPYKDKLLERFLNDAISDPTIMENLNGTDEIKNALVAENARLKKELNTAIEQMKKMISIFSK